MKRKSTLKGVIWILLVVPLLAGCLARRSENQETQESRVASEEVNEVTSTQSGGSIAKLDMPKSEWRELLTPERYGVLFEENTERAFTSPLNEEKRSGTYICAACRLPLFTSDTKFESGTGWPSFFQPIQGHLATKRDYLLLLPRTEYHCIRCGGHQGHVFDDGPPPTGQRWCNNGLALEFVPSGQPLPALRS